jgi:hypothetical protein
MIFVSLVLNVVVLVPVTASLVSRAEWTDSAYGPRSPARDILLAIYLAILASSVVLLVWVLVAPAAWATGAIVALLAVQVVYKLLTAVLVRAGLRNSVVRANIAIAAVHIVTIAVVSGTLY